LGDRRSEPRQSLKYGKHGKQEVKAVIVLLSHLPRASLSPQESDWRTLLSPTGQLGRAASKIHNTASEGATDLDALTSAAVDEGRVPAA
jgi:hypothetical protein